MRAEVKQFLDEYVSNFSKLNADVNSLMLFGSQARNTATITSDIDIAIIMNEDLSPQSRGQLLSLGDEIDHRFDVNLFFTTKSALECAKSNLDTNKHIREEGIILWQS